MQKTSSLYDAIGGQPALLAAVETFYRRVLADPALAPYFAGIPMLRLKGHQAAFLAMALAGPAEYRGRSLCVAHAGLGITDDAFDRVAQHLVATLAVLGVEAGTIDQIVAHVASLRAEIVEPAEAMPRLPAA